jgi:hypothetical protein
VLFAVRSATALHRLLDVLPVFVGDHRIRRRFTLVPGSDFGIDALAALERFRARTVPWSEALADVHDLILVASPKGEVRRLRGPRVLLPHGAGFNKALPGDGSDDSASGLDPAYLLHDGTLLADLHALAHPSQIARLAAECPPAAARATVIGDPTLDRLLASLHQRDRYRAALGTGGRALVVLASTWGPHSLLERRPGLAAQLAAHLPCDAYQLAFVVHPNVYSDLGEFELRERLAPAVDAGMILARPYEEWGALLVAADGVVTDHGSTALYAAALGRAVIGAGDGGGGGELIAGSPMDELLRRVPRLETPGDLEGALTGHRADVARSLAEPAFAEQGQALARLRTELYGLLDLEPPDSPPVERPLPDPEPSGRAPAAFAVRADVRGRTVRVERRPPYTHAPAHHLAVEFDRATARQTLSAGVLFRRGGPTGWTADGWITQILGRFPGRRTAGVVLSDSHCVARRSGGSLVSVRIEPSYEHGRIVRADPAAVLSALHAWLGGQQAVLPADIDCVIAGHTYAVHVEAATSGEADRRC